MLDFERKIKTKVKVTLHSFQNVFEEKEFCIETRLSDIFKTANVTMLTKVILENCYRVLQVTYKPKTKTTRLFFKGH